MEEYFCKPMLLEFLVQGEYPAILHLQGLPMAHDLTLSEELQSYIEVLDKEVEHGLSTEEERTEQERNRKFVEIIVDDIIQSRETLTENKLARIEKLVMDSPDLIKHFLDERFTKEVVYAVSGYVKRTLQLSRMEGSKVPSNITNGYLQEAVRTYILGLPQASVALSRAALEQALKEKLGLQLSGQYKAFQNLLDDARKWHILDKAMELCAREVANAGDGVMHEKPTTLAESLDVLTKLRGVLRHIYSTEGHY